MILVIAEQRDGKLNRATLETIAAAQSTGVAAKVVVIGSHVDAVASEVARADVAEVLVIDNPTLEHYTADGYVQALQAVVDSEKPDLVFLPHT
jgi:electron transfer flavoprotein alpha subunit